MSDHYKYQYFERIDTLVENLNDRFQQEIIEILPDIEIFFIYCLKTSSLVNEPIFDELLSSAGIVHFQD